MTMSQPSPAAAHSTARMRAKQVAPWLIAIAILAYVLSRVPFADLGAVLARVSLMQVMAVAGLLAALTLAVDALALYLAFRSALPEARLPYRTMAVLRGASYLYALLNYAAGQGGIIYFVHRKHNVPLTTSAGVVLMTSAAMLAVMAVAVGAGIWLGAIPNWPELRVLATAATLAAPAYVAVIAWRPSFLARRRALAPLFQAGVGGAAYVVCARAAHLTILIAGHLAMMRLFGIQVPVAAAIAGLPVMFLIAAVPIAPAGLGTTQAAAVTLFHAFAPGGDEAVVLAYSLGAHTLGSAAFAVIGLACFRLTRGQSEESAQP